MCQWHLAVAQAQEHSRRRSSLGCFCLMNAHLKRLRNFNIWTDGWIPKPSLKYIWKLFRNHSLFLCWELFLGRKYSSFFCCLNDHSWEPVPTMGCTGPGIISLLCPPPGYWEGLSLGSLPLKETGFCLQSRRALVSPGNKL